MELCSNGHDEICFNCNFCPICNAEYEHSQEIVELKNDISNLKRENNSLEIEMAALENTVREIEDTNGNG